MTSQEKRAHGVTPGLSQDYVTRTANQQAAFVLPYLHSGMNLLDVGCGPGTITMGLAKVVAPGQVVGVDLDYEVVGKDGGDSFRRFRSRAIYSKIHGVSSTPDLQARVWGYLQRVRKTALDSPTAIAISHTLARRYFGDRNPIGETLTSDGNDAQVTLVFEDLPENTHLKYDALFSANLGMMSSPDDINMRRRQLFGVNVYTYLLMRPGYDPAQWSKVSEAFFERNMQTFGDRINAKWRSWLQPLADIQLYSDLPRDQPTSNRYYLYGFVAVALFTLLVACINYMNLATARASKRAKEVGMRKILGSSRRALVGQFLVESLLLAVVAVLLGLLLARLAVAVTPISQLLGKQISLSFTETPQLYLWVVGLALLVGIGAGLYPALYLSATNQLCQGRRRMRKLP